MRSFDDYESPRITILYSIVPQLPERFADALLESIPIVLRIEDYVDRHVLRDSLHDCSRADDRGGANPFIE